MSQEKSRNVCTDTKPFENLSYQQNETSKILSSNISTSHNKQVVDDLVTVPYMPVECARSDLNASAQLQDIDENTFSQEQTVSLYIWANTNTSKDHKACIKQNGHQFGYIPLNDLKLYRGPEDIWKNAPSILQAHKFMRQSRVPHFLNCRIPVKTQLNPDRWRYYLLIIGTSNCQISYNLAFL